MREQIVTVSNRAGIHARPASTLVRAVQKYNCEVFLERDNDRINGKSIMGVITLCATYGTKLRVITDGVDEENAMETIVQLFNSKFEEE
ncbi:MAG: HPr family phosphocarrier protein [Spirochaetaceae bacterium]|jgi:phosphocarrier protein|nr:HPr family phosphocarrier protein [Spirochaetaceae bacterium]